MKKLLVYVAIGFVIGILGGGTAWTSSLPQETWVPDYESIPYTIRYDPSTAPTHPTLEEVGGSYFYSDWAK